MQTTKAKMIAVAALSLFSQGMVMQAQAEDADVAEGAKLYIAHCKMCHGDNSATSKFEAPSRGSVHVAQGEAEARSDVGMQLAFAPPFGPNLRGVVGRPAGTAAEFVYSAAFLKALTGMTWDEGTLDWWIRDTQAWVPGTVMFYKQKDPEIRRKIIAYLKANH